jgi:hypothetical protein
VGLKYLSPSIKISEWGYMPQSKTFPEYLVIIYGNFINYSQDCYVCPFAAKNEGYNPVIIIIIIIK